jgi:hypothetical protein
MKESVVSVALSRLRLRFPTAADRGPRSTPVARPYSFWSECECPDDCLRDHENE